MAIRIAQRPAAPASWPPATQADGDLHPVPRHADTGEDHRGDMHGPAKTCVRFDGVQPERPAHVAPGYRR